MLASENDVKDYIRYWLEISQNAITRPVVAWGRYGSGGWVWATATLPETFLGMKNRPADTKGSSYPQPRIMGNNVSVSSGSGERGHHSVCSQCEPTFAVHAAQA